MRDIIENLSVYHLKQAYLALLRDKIGHPDIQNRVDRAHDIITKNNIYVIQVAKEKVAIGQGKYKNVSVFKITSENDTYTVIPAMQSCTCPDAERFHCKHRLTVELILNTLSSMKKDKLRIEVMK